MNWAECPGFKKLRFNKQITAFDGIMSLLFSGQDSENSPGKKVIAGGPLSPVEPVYAAGAIAYNPFFFETVRHAVANENTSPVDAAIEAGLGPDFNPWNLVSVGAVAARTNQVGIDACTTVCGCSDDQVKKGLQVMASVTGAPLYFWEVPRFTPEFSGWAIDFVVKELKQLFAWLSARTGQKITDEGLGAAIRLGNLLRRDMLEITQLQQSSRPALPSLEYYILQSSAGDYLNNGEALHVRYQTLIGELREQAGRADTKGMVKRPGSPRIYWLGEDTQDFQIFNVLDDMGASLVGSDTRFSFYYEPVPEEGNPTENLANWIWRMPCNLSIPERVQKTIAQIRAQRADAVIIHSSIGSRNPAGAERLVRDLIKDETGLPVLSIETSLPNKNIDKVKSQMQAFLEANSPQQTR